MKNIDLITQSYRGIGIIDENEAPSAEQGVVALNLLNQMLAHWEGDEIYLQYFEQTAQDADFPCQDYTHKGVIGKLAEALAGHYGVPVPVETARMAHDGYQTIIRKSVVSKVEPLRMTHLPMGRGHGGSGNILTGEDA